MQLSDFDFQLPSHLIAQYPIENRSQSRLLSCSANGSISHGVFSDVLNHLSYKDLLVLNDTRVMKARLYGQKATGGKVEVFVERILDDHTLLVLIRASKTPKVGTCLSLYPGIEATVMERRANATVLKLTEPHPNPHQLLEDFGEVPLPPYIQHAPNASDVERYQTVYAKALGAVAAPTAGLHFTQELLTHIQNKGTTVKTLTLHVGAGTFMPVQTENIADHVMHSERYCVPYDIQEAVVNTKRNGGRVIAVGTTSLRALESWALALMMNNENQCFEQVALESLKTSITPSAHWADTQLFIKPGFYFNVVDCLITNFHLPKSTLMMLVSAFSGQQTIMNAYHCAIEHQYRFFSYGDAMWLNKQP